MGLGRLRLYEIQAFERRPVKIDLPDPGDVGDGEGTGGAGSQPVASASV